MQKKNYKVSIQAPAAKVFHTMLDKATYKQWTSAFNPSSDFEGGWNKGDKICFIGVSKEGKKGGMVAEIAEHIPNRFISIRHYGILDGDQEITVGPLVADWAGAHENYTFEESGGVTTVSVDVDTNEEYLSYFDETWPVALHKLKTLCE